MLKDGKTYKNLDGSRTETIQGRTKMHPEFVYSVSGNWYERATGKFVYSNRHRSHFLLDFETWRDLDITTEADPQ